MGIEKEYDETKSVVEEGLKEVTAQKERSAPPEVQTLQLGDTVHDAVNEPHVGMTKEEKYEFSVNAIAAACHMANRAYCIGIGDTSQPIWEEAPDWQKTSAKNGVRAKLKDPTVTPEQSHEGWLAEKAANGWKYGPVKDPDKKEHPCFVPYAELDAAAKAKDDIFLATVISMGKSLGLL